MANWDERWMKQAAAVAQWSKDPRRKVGCLIIDADNNQLSGGFNGFPRGIADDGRLHVQVTVCWVDSKGVFVPLHRL